MWSAYRVQDIRSGSAGFAILPYSPFTSNEMSSPSQPVAQAPAPIAARSHMCMHAYVQTYVRTRTRTQTATPHPQTHT